MRGTCPREVRYSEYRSKTERTDLAQMRRQACFPRFDIDAFLSAMRAERKASLSCSKSENRHRLSEFQHRCRMKLLAPVNREEDGQERLSWLG